MSSLKGTKKLSWSRTESKTISSKKNTLKNSKNTNHSKSVPHYVGNHIFLHIALMMTKHYTTLESLSITVVVTIVVVILNLLNAFLIEMVPNISCYFFIFIPAGNTWFTYLRTRELNKNINHAKVNRYSLQISLAITTTLTQKQDQHNCY